MFGSKDDECKSVIKYDATDISFSGSEEGKNVSPATGGGNMTWTGAVMMNRTGGGY